ncbi:unnamed protein product [Closterium sp. NIES-54]
MEARKLQRKKASGATATSTATVHAAADKGVPLGEMKAKTGELISLMDAEAPPTPPPSHGQSFPTGAADSPATPLSVNSSASSTVASSLTAGGFSISISGSESGAGATAPVPSSSDSSSLLDLNVDVYGGMDQVYLKAAGMRSDFTITFGATVNYQLHKFPLYSKTDYFSKHAVEEEKSSSRRNSGDPESSANGKRARLDLSNLPGGIETFKLVACFCYGVPITITPDNVTALYCAAIYLDMRDDPRAAMCGGPYDCNLLSLASRHLTSYLSHPRAALTVLQSCDASSAIRASAESAGLLLTTVNAVARLVVKEAGKGDNAYDGSDAAAVETDKAGREEKAKDKVADGAASEAEGKTDSAGPGPLWLSPQLLQLSLPTFVQLHAAVSAMGMSALHLCALLEAYCNTWLPFPVVSSHVVNDINAYTSLLSLDFPNFCSPPPSVNQDVSSTSTSSTAASADAQTTSMWKPILEAAVALLFALSAGSSATGQAAKGAGGLPSIQLLVRLLRLCPEVDASESAKSHLQTMIGRRITECQVDHLLPLPPSEILALLTIFTSPDANAAAAAITPPTGSSAAAVEGAGAASLSQAASIVDIYLKAISTSPNSSSISPDSFISLATALPLVCRPSHDALYEAVAAYVATRGWGLGGSGKGSGGGERGGEEVKLLVGLIQPEKLSEPVADAASSTSLWPPSFTVAVLTWQKQLLASHAQQLMSRGKALQQQREQAEREREQLQREEQQMQGEVEEEEGKAVAVRADIRQETHGLTQALVQVRSSISDLERDLSVALESKARPKKPRSFFRRLFRRSSQCAN